MRNSAVELGSLLRATGARVVTRPRATARKRRRRMIGKSASLKPLRTAACGVIRAQIADGPCGRSTARSGRG